MECAKAEGCIHFLGGQRSNYSSHTFVGHQGKHLLEQLVALIFVVRIVDLGFPPSAQFRMTAKTYLRLQRISRAILRCLGESWQIIKSIEFVVESMGSDPDLMACPEPAQSNLQLSFEIQFAGQLGHFEIAVPSAFFAPAMTSQAEQPSAEDSASKVDIERNARLLEDAKVELEVRLEGPRLSFRDFLALQQGQVVKLEHALNAPVLAVVNGDPALTGHILGAGRKRAFQVEETFST